MLKVPLTQQHSKIAWSDPVFVKTTIQEDSLVRPHFDNNKSLSSILRSII